MSLSTAIALLLVIAALVLIVLEVARELSDPETRQPRTWRPLLSGALTAAVILALVATLTLFHSVAG